MGFFMFALFRADLVFYGKFPSFPLCSLNFLSHSVGLWSMNMGSLIDKVVRALSNYSFIIFSGTLFLSKKYMKPKMAN